MILAGWLMILAGCQEQAEIPSSGKFIDYRDNHEYEWVTIGTQVWMAENLAYLPAVSPPAEASDTLPIYYVFGYEGTDVDQAKHSSGYSDYGVFYNWPAAMNGVCPEKWHLPSDTEWDYLVNYLGGDVLAGKKMKSTHGWKRDSGVPGRGTNASGFNGLPAGSRNNGGVFYKEGYNALFWASTDNGQYSAWYRHLGYKSYEVSRYFMSKRFGFSVRCLKDN